MSNRWYNIDIGVLYNTTMKTTTKSLGFLAIANTPKLTSTVNGGYRKNCLLSFTLMAVLFLINFSVKAQANPGGTTLILNQFTAKSAQFDKLFNDESNNRLIFTYVKDVTVLNGVDLTPGVRVLFMDKKTGKASPAPSVLTSAKHVYMYEGKLFYKIDSTSIYSYDLKNGNSKLLLTTNSQIISFWNMSGNRILVNTRNGGDVTMPLALVTGITSRLAVYNYETGEATNISNEPNIYQVFNIGEKIVFFESGSWFNKPGVPFRANVYDPKTGRTYSRTDFNILGLNIPTSDSTFILWYNPVQGGAWRMAVVNVNQDLNGTTFNREDRLALGGFWAPPITGKGGDIDPASPSPYFMNNERVAGGNWWVQNLLTNEVNNRADDEIWATNLSTFKEVYVGKFYDQKNNRSMYGGKLLDGRFVSLDEYGFFTTKLYGETGAIKNTKITGVSVYPNPAVDGFVTIDVPANADVEVYSVTGQLTFSQKVFNSTQIPVNSGINIVKVKIDNSVQIVKIIGR